MEKQVEEVIESLNPDERYIIPSLGEGTLTKIAKKSELDNTRALRALQFLSNKKIVKLKASEEETVDLGDNGVIYLRSGLPERRLLDLLSENKSIEIEEARRGCKLSENELKAAIGVLKKKVLISLEKGRIVLKASISEIGKKSLEEQLIESLPLHISELKPEQKLALQALKERKNIVEVKSRKEFEVELTEFGKKVIAFDFSKIAEMIETLTP
ncbi:MAG: hypothetical protein AABX71_01745, partial [Nanoarchaeota archaeon]